MQQTNKDKFNNDKEEKEIINNEEKYEYNIGDKMKLLQEIMNGQYVNINKNNQAINDLKNNLSPSKEANVEILKKDNNGEKSNNSLESENTLFQTLNKKLNKTQNSFNSGLYNYTLSTMIKDFDQHSKSEITNIQPANNTTTIENLKNNQINIKQMNNTIPHLTKEKENNKSISSIQGMY